MDQDTGRGRDMDQDMGRGRDMDQDMDQDMGRGRDMDQDMGRGRDMDQDMDQDMDHDTPGYGKGYGKDFYGPFKRADIDSDLKEEDINLEIHRGHENTLSIP
jgi:hypothetical protein